DGVESQIGDEECDILIDVDDDPAEAERIREKRQKEQKKAKKQTARKTQSAKKSTAKKSTAKTTTAKSKKKKDSEAETDVEPQPEKETAQTGSPASDSVRAELLPPEETEEEAASAPVEPAAETTEQPVESQEEAGATTAKPEEPAAEVGETPPAEVSPPTEEEVPAPVEEPEEKPKKPKEKKKKKEEKESGFAIGRAIEHVESPVEVVRADGSAVDGSELEVQDTEATQSAEEPEEETSSVLAEAERQQEEEELKRVTSRHRDPASSQAKPDPAVVAEVKRKAAERQTAKPAAKRPPAAAKKSGTKTGKTARKRQKKAEKARSEEDMRKKAAQAVREYQSGAMGAGRKKRRRRRDTDAVDSAEAEQQPQVIEVGDSMTVEELAAAMEMPVNDLILELMEFDVLASKNHALEQNLIRTIAEAFGYEVRAVIPAEEQVLAPIPDDPADLQPRPPVVTVMGHVDHGKTSLLDRVREANVAEGEAGGITQHIAAYDVQMPNGRVVFLDTPGHEAFTQMRSRGAQATDVVVLVVAADDGIMPQTEEAIDHARAAGVPIVVAVNKCDKPDAQPDKIRQELTRYDLVDEAWGGNTIIRNISAKEGDGVNDLMEMLVLESDLLELKANPNKRAQGVVIESEISRGQGPVAWVLIQEGTLRPGEVFLAGETFGRVRTMIDSHSKQVEEAGPSTPVVVTGFERPANAGDHFIEVAEERIAREIAEKRQQISRQKQGAAQRKITLEDLQSRLASGEKRELNVVLKADVQGTVDALSSNLLKLGNEEVQLRLVHTAVGGINESDVLLASASEAVIIGFHVSANTRAVKLAEQEGVDIRTYRVIYEAIEDVRKAMEGLLEPEMREVVTGHAEIRDIFRASGVGNIAGCYVTDGEITRGSRARIIRDGIVIREGRVGSLKRLKDDARTVSSGYECGIKFDNYEDIRLGDIIETYRQEAVAKTLA
ncbi:MAG: translation initiation factor IF-2, partial [Candidatus Hydrogenedentota bacterium]